MDANILIQRLTAGETVIVTDTHGVRREERRAPTSTSLQAARTLQKLLELDQANARVIHQLTTEVESLHEQIKLLQSNQSSGQASTQSGTESSNQG